VSLENKPAVNAAGPFSVAAAAREECTCVCPA